MNKILTTTIVATLVSTSIMAAETTDFQEEMQKQFREKYDILLRVGVDALGGNDDTTKITSGKKGLDRKMGWEVVVGAEEKVKDFEWGSRRTMSIYSHGDGTYHNGTYSADITNIGVETTGATYFKATQYFKPYIGVGLGLNINDYNDNGAYRNAEQFQITVNAVCGVSGELFTGIGYYAEYKYRFAPQSKEQVTINGSTVEIENQGVNGGVFMTGLSYQF